MIDIDLTGAIDLHVHTSPDVYDRSVDDVTMAREAEAQGMRAVMLKSHHTLTADRAALASQHVGRTGVYGGLALNLTVGGLNVVAVETALKFGAKQIWMPTLHAENCLQAASQHMFREEAVKGRQGIRIVDAQGRLHPSLYPILEMIRDAKVILGTGHLAPEESLELLRAARKMGLARLLVTHPLMSFTRFSADQMLAAVKLGATLEFDRLSCCPTWEAAVDPAATARAIQLVGPRHCVLATDGGQPFNPQPATMLREFAETLHGHGLNRDDLRVMMCDNPARLLDI